MPNVYENCMLQFISIFKPGKLRTEKLLLRFHYPPKAQFVLYKKNNNFFLYIFCTVIFLIQVTIHSSIIVKFLLQCL